MFNDPAGQYRFDLPLGWAYDPERSHLITVAFAPWERPDETVSVRAMPTFAPPEVSPEQWYRALGERCFPPRMQPFTEMPCGGLPAALAEVHEAEPEAVHRRLLVVRGTRLDVIAEHRAPEPSSGPRLSEALAALGRRLEVPTNRFLPAFVEQQEVADALQRAQEAVQREDWPAVLEPAMEAERAARATYLYSVVANTPLPEIPAIIALMDALTGLAQAGASLPYLRDAEHLALRALYTLHHLPFVPPQRRQEVGEALTSRLELIAQLQALIARQGEPGPLPPSPGLGLAALRVEPLLEQAGQLAQAGRNELARWHCETALQDVGTAFLALRREAEVQAMPPKLAQYMASVGATTPEEQRALVRQLVRRLHLENLQQALTLLADLQSLANDLVGAAETNEFLVTVAQELSRPQETLPGRHLLPPEKQPLHQAYALIQSAASLAAIEDEPSLEEAHQALDRAEKLLDETGEEGVLRAWLCLVRAFTLHAQRRVEGALETIERGLRAAAADPERTEQYVRELKTIQSQFLIHLGELQKARDIAAEVVLWPEGDGPRARLDRASHYLNLALIDTHLGRPEEAAHSLREALRRVLEVAPCGEEAMRILMVASELFRERDALLSHQLNLAAAATLDARRAAIPSDRFRVGFDESARRRQVYGDLVGRLLTVGAGAEAVAAADRSRARSLNELLVGPAPADDPLAPAEKPPALAGPEVRSALREGAEYILRQADVALRQRGAVTPLRTDEIAALAAEIDAPALLIQPVHQRVALLLVRPSGEVEATFSPLPLDELLNLTDAVRKQFYIRLVPRGDNDPAGFASPNGDLDAALAALWNALIGPVNDYLRDEEPLILGPYREFALLPFALLQDPQRRPLIEGHALAVVPSLATLRALRERGPWTRPRPAHAYVAGDPALAPRHLAAGMKRLPAARAEAEAVAAILKTTGVREENVLLRLDDAAHEESYRREARGSDLVHLSCHAKAGIPAYTSCLYLAPHGPYEGLLLASEVADVKLDEALVFLAACETGQGRATADGVIGLGRAFLEAGARAVVLSLWKVEDAATAALVGHFYRALCAASQPLGAAEALRAAMLATRADLQIGRLLGSNSQPLDAHPANWAPFIVLGDGLSR